MKVYVLSEVEQDGRFNRGVFATLEAAKAGATLLLVGDWDEWNLPDSHFWRAHTVSTWTVLDIEEFELEGKS